MTERNILFYETNGYNPIGVGWKKYAGGEKTEQVVSGCYTLYYVLSGTGNYTVNHIDYHAAAGDMIVCAPSDSFCCRINAQDPAEHIWITFTIYGKVSNYFAYPFLHAPQLRELFTALQKQIEQETADWHTIQNALQEIGNLTGVGRDPDVQIVYDTARYIQNNVCSTDLSIGVLADRISVSRFRLVRAFAKVKNMPPMEFVIRCRLERACELIRSHRYSLSEVSQMTGYKNYSTFARVFKKYYDITPKEYRKKFLHEKTQGNI